MREVSLALMVFLPSLAACGGPCNGAVDLCKRPLNEVAFATTHNAMSNRDEGWVAPNQEHGLEQQLADGIRALMLDVYSEGGELLLCHGFCSLGSRPLVEALGAVESFLTENPREVVVFLFQDAISAADMEQAFAEVGLTQRVFTYRNGDPWPTLEEMIRLDQRVLATAESQGPPPQWYHHLWDLASDTPYEFSSVEAFSCDPNRGEETNELFLINHWISTPLSSRENASLANSPETLGDRVESCRRQRQFPNFVAVDFYDQGALFEVVARLNGLD